MNTTQLKTRLAEMTAEMSRYEERLAHLSAIEKARATAIDERDVALKNVEYWQARAERAEAECDNLRARVAELEAELTAAQPAIEAWAQHQADNERQEKLQEEMIAEGLIKRPFWQ